MGLFIFLITQIIQACERRAKAKRLAWAERSRDGTWDATRVGGLRGTAEIGARDRAENQNEKDGKKKELPNRAVAGRLARGQFLYLGFARLSHRLSYHI